MDDLVAALDWDGHTLSSLTSGTLSFFPTSPDFATGTPLSDVVGAETTVHMDASGTLTPRSALKPACSLLLVDVAGACVGVVFDATG